MDPLLRVRHRDPYTQNARRKLLRERRKEESKEEGNQ
jgi:hypothetical protein